VDAHSNAARSRLAVVSSQRALAPLIELTLGV